MIRHKLVRNPSGLNRTDRTCVPIAPDNFHVIGVEVVWIEDTHGDPSVLILVNQAWRAYDFDYRRIIDRSNRDG